MIAYLHGILMARTETGCVVLTSGGVGYTLGLTVSAAATLPKIGEDVAFYVHTIVREDAIDLYGFPALEDKEVFALLLSINKLGPKTVLAILSVFSPEALQRLILTDDYTPLTQVPGIGKKSAQRIFLDMKFKLENAGELSLGVTSQGLMAGGIFRDALAGLVNLGYDEANARQVLETVFEAEPDLDVSEALRESLKHMAKRHA